MNQETEGFVVRGEVRHSDGEPLVGAEVRAFDKDLRREELLGQTTTDQKGKYEIRYTRAKFSRAEKQSADLVVRVYDQQGKELTIRFKLTEESLQKLQAAQIPAAILERLRALKDREIHGESVFLDLVRSTIGPEATDTYSSSVLKHAVRIDPPIIFNAKAVEVVNLFLGEGEYKRPSEFERLVEEIRPLLEGMAVEGVDAPTFLDEVADLRDDDKHQDISFVAAETGLPRQHIEFLVAAARLALKTVALKAPLPAEVFYGWARQNLTTDLGLLLVHDLGVLRGALERAIKENVVPLRIRSELDKILEAVKDLAAQQALAQPEQPGTYSLGQLLDTGGFTQDLKKRFMDSFVRNVAPLDDLWRKLRDDPAFGDKVVNDLQFTLELGKLAQNHVPLVARIQKDRREGKITALRDLTRFGIDDWLRLIEGQGQQPGTGFPPSTSGEKPEEKARNYARTLSRTIEKADPGAVFEHKIRVDPDVSGKNEFVKFFRNNEGRFDIATTKIDLFVRDHGGTAFAGIEDRQALVRQLKGLQRVLRIAPEQDRSDTALALWKEGLDSAQKVARRGRGAFVKKYADKLGGEEKAREVHRRARHHSAIALTVFGKYSSAFHSLPVIGGWIREVADIPNWSELFGPLALCECEHCRSVYSPAAYLVDLLEYLKDLDAAPPYDSHLGAQDVLFHFKRSGTAEVFDRRPDIGEIEVSCENTNTPVPYVDLVNEILENAVAPIVIEDDDLLLREDLDAGRTAGLRNKFEERGLTLSPRATISTVIRGTQWRISDEGFRFVVEWRSLQIRVSVVPQTVGSAEELKANPGYINEAAYEVLAQAVYPWDLPFNRSVEEARAYLEHLGVPRYQLMEGFLGDPAAGELTDVAVATDYLGMTSVDRQIIEGEDLAPPRNPWDFWRLSESGNRLSDPLDSSQPPATDSWVDVLKRVSIFLQRSGITYKELLELLDTRFINPEDRPGGRLLLHATDPEDGCNVSKLEIAVLNAEDLNRIHRFVRLQRELGWTIRDLDRTIGALGETAILVKLAHIKRLRADLRTPLVEILSWWAPIDTAVYEVESQAGVKALYDQLFLSKAVLNPEDLVYLLDAGRRELASTGGTISGNASTVLAGLRMAEADLAELLTGEVPDELNLANLSSLHRIASFSRALRLSIQEFLSIKALTGINPFDPLRTQDTLRFVEKARKIRASGLRVVELDYLLRHKIDTPSVIAPTEESIALLLEEIRDGLQKIAAENELASDSTGELTRRRLSLVLESDKVEAAIAILEDGGARDAATKTRHDAFIRDHFSQFVSDIANAQTELVGVPPDPPALAERTDRFGYVLARLLPHLRDVQSRSLVTQKLSEPLRLETATAEVLLRYGLTVPGDSAKAITAFLARPFRESAGGITETEFADVFQTFRKLHKAVTFISKLRIRADELPWILEHGPSLGWIDINVLPLTEELTPPSEWFAGWERLGEVFGFVERYPALREKLTSEEWNRVQTPFDLQPGMSLPREPALLVLFDLVRQFGVAGDSTQAEGELLRLVSERTGWDLDDITFLAGPEGFPLTFPDDYRDEKWLFRLNTCFPLFRRLGVSAEKARPWVDADLTSANARTIKQSVKAKYDDKRWPQIAKPIQDGLREKQRAALVSYLVAVNDLYDSNGLYQYLLIDPEMSACMMTSRIKQAISSVQLFIQRCMMGLEVAVTPDDDNAREWEWRKNYRVWEANRKVFLYPENWIEPELRDDKSSFFRDFERELLQDDITTETVENAYIHYLQKLNEVARLEIAGMYHQLETAREVEIDVFHVFARTRNTPHIYYYRKWIDQSYWTPWERVDADIEGDHLIPVVWNRRVYLFWPIFEEKQEKVSVTMPAGNTPLQEGRRFWEIGLAWSCYENGKWQAKKVSVKKVSGRDIPSYRLQDFSSPPENLKIKFMGRSVEQQPVEIWMHDAQYASGLAVWAKFVVQSCDESVEVIQFNGLDGRSPMQPPGSHVDHMKFTEDADHDVELVLVSGAVTGTRNFRGPLWVGIRTLASRPGAFRIAYPHQFFQFVSQAPFFYEDEARTFFIVPTEVLTQFWRPGLTGAERFISVLFGSLVNAYSFQPFYHPWICDFIRQLNQHGIDGLLAPGTELPLRRQTLHRDIFDQYSLAEQSAVRHPHPVEDVDFSFGGAYSLYNWELFFHAPFLIADRLSKNQRFQEAQKWFHYIFDPTDRSTNPSERYWKVRPFFNDPSGAQRIDELMRLLNSGNPDMAEQVRRWEDDPFNPHLIARLRPMAYQKAVVMKYIDNLVAWGDQLFRRDTIESINEATQLYILAAEILGPRPTLIPPRGEAGIHTYNELASEPPGLDEFSNALVQIENLLPAFDDGIDDGIINPVLAPVLYFCIPKNDKLLSYWNTVADRLFKIRHCMNIEGVVRQLPLFEPPIDPALLVRARAAGVDIQSALSELNAPLPHYRFQFMVQKAMEFCADVRSLGGELLSALEKRDAEVLSLLRSTQEINLLNAVRLAKEQQIDETKQTLEGLKKSQEALKIRRDFYANISFMNPSEESHFALMEQGLTMQAVQGMTEYLGNVLSLIPDFKVGSPTTMGASFGGSQLGGAIRAMAGYLGTAVSIINTTASMSATLGGYQRRFDDWKLQERMAVKELEQFDKQIAAAEIRVAIAEREFQNHELQVENAKEADAFMRSKFTNQELYDWTVGQISAIYFQSYQMAYDLAKRAEKAFQHEIGDPEATFIKFGYWDSLKKGLLSGERLNFDLKRLDMTFLERNERDHEITKHVSLAMLDPVALLKLKETGGCFITVPETIFDLDYPGHYMRRIKSVSLTIPCVTGPYTSVSCTLTLLKHSVRKDPSLEGGTRYARNTTPEGLPDPDDGRFRDRIGAIESISTSNAQNDSGLFELNFRDERYLPFEGAGIISDWELELPKDFRQFDYDTISDVVFHIRYTARDGGETLKTAAEGALKASINVAMTLADNRGGFYRLFSARHEFPNQWHRFLHPQGTAQTLELPLTLDRFPFVAQERAVRAARAISMTNVHLFFKLRERDRAVAGMVEEPTLESVPGGQRLRISFSPAPASPTADESARLIAPEFELPHGTTPVTAELPVPLVLEASQEWLSTLDAALTETVRVGTEDIQRLKPDALEDFLVVCQYNMPTEA